MPAQPCPVPAAAHAAACKKRGVAGSSTIGNCPKRDTPHPRRMQAELYLHTKSAEESNAVAACKQASLQPLAVCHIKAAHLFHAGDRLGVVRMLVKSREASARYVGSGTSPTAIGHTRVQAMQTFNVHVEGFAGGLVAHRSDQPASMQTSLCCVRVLRNDKMARFYYKVPSVHGLQAARPATGMPGMALTTTS